LSSETDTFSGTKPVDERHRVDPARLEAWLAAHVAGFNGPLELRQFKGGQSNPTYELRTPARAYVLRRKPPGKLLPSAHAVDREFRVISALHPSGFPSRAPTPCARTRGHRHRLLRHGEGGRPHPLGSAHARVRAG
jgi:aminoglycoside phosphotransferase (APT) family kinase protein